MSVDVLEGMMSERFESGFDEAMRNVYHSALQECDYRAKVFLKMVDRDGGIKTAKKLLDSSDHPSYGFKALRDCGCLSLTMEALVLKEPWRSLFTEEELQIAQWRLEHPDL